MTHNELLNYQHESKWRKRILVACGLLLLTVVVFGLTTSSLSLNSASGTDSSAQVIWGDPEPTRSDEWLRSTPYWIGRWNDDWSPSLLTPLEYRSEPSLGKTISEWIVFPERQFALSLPTRVGFPLLWWLPTIGALAASTLLLLRFTRSSSLALSGGLLTVLAPVVAWWSFSPLEIVWPAATSVLMLDIARAAWSRVGRTGRQPPQTVLYAAVSGIAASRIVFSYAPWAIVTVLVFSGIAYDFIIRKHGWRRAVVPVLVSIATALLAAGYRLLLVRGEYSALADTVYPGQRRSAAGTSEIPIMSGVLGGLNQIEKVAGSVVGTNLSEIARGWTILLVPVFVIVTVVGTARIARVRWLLRGPTAPIVPYTTVTIAGFILLWSLLSWPSALTKFNPLTLVSPDRAAQMIGVLAPILVGLVLPVTMSSVPIHVRRLTGLVVGVLTFALVYQAARSVKTWLPGLSSGGGLAIAATSGVLVGGVVFARRNAAVFAVAIPLAFLSVAWVNPITRGLGDLVLAPVAGEVRSAVQAEDGRVASDNFFVDAMVAANGLPQLSGLQNWGPNVETWSVLDPEYRFVEHWNRGTSYLRFEWAGSGEELAIRDQGDQIFVRIDPCDHRLDGLGLGFVVSMAPRQDECLTERTRFTWGGLDNWLYKRERVSSH